MSTDPEVHASPSLQVATRNKRFYIDAVIFQVEDELYQVSRPTIIAASHVFRDMFALPQSETESTQGLLDRDPIILHGVKKGAFEDILKIIPKKRKSKPKSIANEHRDPAVALTRWTAVLELSRMWGMRIVHTTAHEQITTHFVSHSADSDPRSKLIMARKYALVDLFIIASREYVMQDRIPITHQEAMTIGSEYAFGLVALREERYERRLARALEPLMEPGSSVQDASTKNPWRIRAVDSASKSPGSSTDRSDEPEVESAVKEKFSVEIEELQREYDSFFASSSDSQKDS